jgi:hypothetical protein
MSLMPWNDLLVMRSYGNEQWREVGYSIMWDGIEVGISGVSFYQTGIYEKPKTEGNDEVPMADMQA